MKKIFILCSCLLLLLLATGCGGRKEELQSATHMAPSSGTIAPEIESIPQETIPPETKEEETTVIIEEETEIQTEPLIVEEEFYYEEETIPYYEEETQAYIAVEEETIQYDKSPQYYESSDFSMLGEINWNGWRWTWYSQNVLPGGGLNIPGRHVDENGYVCDENGNICLASSVLEYGTVVETPFGKTGCVYDSGCDADILDVYVAW